MRHLSQHILSFVLVLPFSAALEACIGRPRGTSGTKNCLNLFLVKSVGAAGATKRYANNAKCGVIITRIGKPRISSAEKFPREWVPEPKNEMDWVLRSCLSIGESAVRRF